MSGKDDKLTHSLGENHAFERLMEYINSQGAYHPRTQDVSNQLSKEIVRDLYSVCTTFRRDVDRGLASFDLNIELRHEKRTHRVDLVIGTIEEEQYEQTILIPATSPEPLRITQTPPSEIRLVMEHKTVATAHRNVYNRSRIMAELATFLRGSYDEVVSAVSLMIGTSQTFLNYETFNRVKNALEALCEETRYSLEEMEGLLGTGDPKLHELLSIPAVKGVLLTYNRADEPQNTLKKMVLDVPLRENVGEEDPGYDAFIVQFCNLNNIDPASLVVPEFFENQEYVHLRYENALMKLANEYDARFE